MQGRDNGDVAVVMTFLVLRFKVIEAKDEKKKKGGKRG